VAFAYAHAAGESWRDCVESCADRLGRPGAGLGFVYLTDVLVDNAEQIVDVLRERTGVAHWAGTVGTGVLATGAEYQDEPAIAAMILELDARHYGVFSGRLPLQGHASHFAVAHADPQAPDVPGLITDLSARLGSGYLVGGISSSRTKTVQVANDVISGGVSGVGFSQEVALATRHTQGCAALTGRFRITECEENVIAALDGRPALDVLLEAAGNDLKSSAQFLVGLPVPGTDTGDYVVRNLVGLDPKNKLIAIGDMVENGAELMFCRRDAAAARQDLTRILGELREVAPQPRGALYFSCVARGEHMFGRRGAEQALIRDALGDVPLVGFFCNGEISHDRLYGYTGVLAVFS
jgi:small ligand-binding sensory domain FIST